MLPVTLCRLDANLVAAHTPMETLSDQSASYRKVNSAAQWNHIQAPLSKQACFKDPTCMVRTHRWGTQVPALRNGHIREAVRPITKCASRPAWLDPC